MNRDKFDIFVENNLVIADSGVTTGNDIKYYADKSDDRASVVGGDASMEIKLSNEYGGADGMTNSIEWSFIALRGFSPITIQDNVNPFNVDKTFYEELPLNYRMATFEFQKCDAYDAYEASVSLDFQADLLHEIQELNDGGAFRSSILVKDTTHQVVVDLLTQLQATADKYEEYKIAAEDTCSFNEGTGFFNQYFIDAVSSNWPDTASAPYFKAVVELIIFEDIFFSTHGGDTLSTVEEIKKVMHNVSPATGTLTGIQTLWDRIQLLRTFIQNVIDEFGEEVEPVGHAYGHFPYYSQDYDEVSDYFTEALESIGITPSSATGTEGFHIPAKGYDNYPLYPIELDVYQSTYTLAQPPDEDLVRDMDVTDGLNTIVEGLIDDYELSLQIEGWLIDAAMDAFVELENRLGFDTGMGFLIDNLDILQNLAFSVGSTFPQANDFLNGLADNYMNPYGVSGNAAALNTLYVVENFTSVSSLMNDVFNQLSNLDVADLQGVMSPELAGVFASGNYTNSVTHNSYMASASPALTQITGFQLNMSMLGSAATTQFRNFSWL